MSEPKDLFFKCFNFVASGRFYQQKLETKATEQPDQQHFSAARQQKQHLGFRTSWKDRPVLTESQSVHRGRKTT